MKNGRKTMNSQPNKLTSREAIIWTSRVLAGVAFVCYIVTVLTLASSNLVPIRYLAIAMGLSALVFATLLLAMWRWRNSWKVALVLCLAFLMILGISAYTYRAVSTAHSFVQTITAPKAKQVDVVKPFIVYISGIDSTENPGSKARSDVNILAVVNPEKNQILLVNTPRDYYVTLAGIGARDKLTHAGLYGVEESMKTLSILYGVKVEYYLRINFTSLVDTVDALGGIEVASDYDFSADGFNFNTGTNHVDGKSALAFSRERHSFEGGDRVRGQNQQRVIEGIIKKSTSPEILANYHSALKSLEGGLLTNVDSHSIEQLVNTQLSKGKSWQVTSISVTGTDSQNITYSAGSQLLYVMEPDMASVQIARTEITRNLATK